MSPRALASLGVGVVHLHHDVKEFPDRVVFGGGGVAGERLQLGEARDHL